MAPFKYLHTQQAETFPALGEDICFWYSTRRYILASLLFFYVGSLDVGFRVEVYQIYLVWCCSGTSARSSGIGTPSPPSARCEGFPLSLSTGSRRKHLPKTKTPHPYPVILQAAMEKSSYQTVPSRQYGRVRSFARSSARNSLKALIRHPSRNKWWSCRLKMKNTSSTQRETIGKLSFNPFTTVFESIRMSISKIE